MLEFDTSWIGKEFDRYTYQVTKEEIMEFAASIGETNPLYTDENAMPGRLRMGGSWRHRRSVWCFVARR